MGVLAAAVLAGSKGVVVTRLLHLSPPVQADLAAYWWLRVALVPVVLLNMAVAGILQVGGGLLAGAFVCLLLRQQRCTPASWQCHVP